MHNPNILLRQFDEEAVQGTADDLMNDNFPGTENRTREEVVAVVRSVHEETIQLVVKRELRAADAAAYEFRRYLEELRT
jgi:hypothetical protein